MNDEDYVLPDQLRCHLGLEYRSSLKCFHLNTQSARNKGDLLELLFDEMSIPFDIIMLSETWYSCDSEILTLPMYNSFYLNRGVCRGGGVAMLAKNNLECVTLSDYCKITKDYEVLTLLHSRTVFSVCYRPPDGNLAIFFISLTVFWDL